MGNIRSIDGDKLEIAFDKPGIKSRGRICEQAMSQLLCLSLDLPARITEPDVAEFEMVFSELLNSAAVSYRRNGIGNGS